MRQTSVGCQREEQRVAVGGGVQDGTGSDARVAAGSVIHQHFLPEAGAHALGEGAGRCIARASRRRRDDQADCLAGISWLRARRGHPQRQCADNKASRESVHLLLRAADGPSVTGRDSHGKRRAGRACLNFRFSRHHASAHSPASVVGTRSRCCINFWFSAVSTNGVFSKPTRIRMMRLIDVATRTT